MRHEQQARHDAQPIQREVVVLLAELAVHRVLLGVPYDSERGQRAPSLAPMTNHRPAVLAGFLGWTLDAFDFFVVVMTLTAIAKEFHKTDAEIAASITLTLAFRPVGAFIFGLLADRYGRRLPLMLDLVFYSLVEVLSGLAPSYTAFLVLRALFGIGMGGEWGVGASLVMEKVPPRLRGVFSGLLQQGYAAGYLLAALCYFFIFPHWGWRPLFFIGGLPALLALYVRFRVKESEVWRRTRHDSWRHLGRAIVSHWRVFLYLWALMTMMNFVSHGTQDLYPTFLQRDWGFTPQRRAVLTAISMVGALTGGILVGLYSDRIGRRRAIALALTGAFVMIPAWAFAPSCPASPTSAECWSRGPWPTSRRCSRRGSPTPGRWPSPRAPCSCCARSWHSRAPSGAASSTARRGGAGAAARERCGLGVWVGVGVALGRVAPYG